MFGFYRTYTLPFSEKIPVFLEKFLKKIPLHRRIWRFLGHYLYSEFLLRKSQKVNQITSQHQRILWIQWVDAYLGDSLMDLSSRVLLKNKKIDLLTKSHVAEIYQGDTVFNDIFTNAKQCNAEDYDLLIIGSYRKRELKNLTSELLQLPHTSLYGYYHVQSFNRLYFSYFHINHLLSKPYNFEYIKNTAKPSLPISHNDINIIDKHNLPNNFITIAVGGASKDRTYTSWNKVVKILLTEKIVENIVLVGKDTNQEVKNIQTINSDRIMNLTNVCSFNQTAEIIKRSKMLLCCDGGLLHAANAVEIPIIGLFYCINPMARLIKKNQSYALFNKDNINNINSYDVVEKVIMLQNKIREGINEVEQYT